MCAEVGSSNSFMEEKAICAVDVDYRVGHVAQNLPTLPQILLGSHTFALIGKDRA